MRGREEEGGKRREDQRDTDRGRGRKWRVRGSRKGRRRRKERGKDENRRGGKIEGGGGERRYRPVMGHLMSLWWSLAKCKPSEP